MKIVQAWFVASVVVGAGTVAQVPVGEPPPAPLPAGVDALAKAVDALPKPGEAYGREVSALVDAFPTYLGDGTQHEDDIVIEASDSTAVCLVRVAKAWALLQPQCEVTVHQSSTTRGMRALLEGRTTMVAMSRPLKPDEVERLQAGGGTAHQVPIARDGVAVFVHCDNPIAGLTRRQCNAIFSATHTMTPELVLRWDDLDPASPLGEEFFPLYMRDIRTGTMQRLMEWCMPGEPLTTIGVFVEASPSSVVNACCAYRNAIGVSSSGAAQARSRMLPLAEADGGPYIAPTVSAIADGTYPLARQLSLVVVTDKDGAVPPHVLAFLRYLWSEDGQDIVGQSRLVPADRTKIPPVLGEPVDDHWR
jgi:phosphate transport system substrate-binding protein